MQRHAATSLATRLPPDPSPDGDALRSALLDSRRRWRSFVALGSDLAFETDAGGRFTFVWPEVALGWPEASLLGRTAATLLATEGFDPFATCGSARGRTAWLRTRDGGAVLMRFCVEPLHGGGVRGVASDATAGERGDASRAEALRRAEMADHVVASMRKEVLTSRMVEAVLREAMAACGADGAVVLTRAGPGTRVRNATGPVPEIALAALAAKEGEGDEGVEAVATAGPVLVFPVPDRLGTGAALVLWRTVPERFWNADDAALGCALARVIGTVMEQDEVQHELARQARTDPLTALLNRRAFADELERRLARVQSGDGGGVLLAVDLNGFKPVNDRHGHEMGDAVLVAVAGLLRHTFRPTDLLARLGGDEFAVWLDGADELTAAERADELCGAALDISAAVLPDGAEPVGMSVGVAVADPGDMGVDDLLRRADAAMFTAKTTGGSGWHVDAGVELGRAGSMRA